MGFNGNQMGDGFADAIIQQQIEKLEKNQVAKLEFNPVAVYYMEKYWVTDNICIGQFTVDDYIRHQEGELYNVVAPFISNPTSLRVQLWDMGIDWNNITDFELFSLLIKDLDMNFVAKMYQRTMTTDEMIQYVVQWQSENNASDEETEDFFKHINPKDESLLKPLELPTFELYSKNIGTDENGEPILVPTLYSNAIKMEITQDTYEKMCRYIRYMFNSYPEVEHCKGKTLKKQLINNDRLKQAKAREKGQGSTILELISFALNHPGFKYKKNELREVGMVEFNDCIQRLQIYESTHALFSGMYSGFCDTKHIDKELFNFMRPIEMGRENDITNDKTTQ